MNNPTILVRKYIDHDNSQKIGYAVDDVVCESYQDVLLRLNERGIPINYKQLIFIRTKHRIPRELYETYNLQFIDEVDHIPTEYPKIHRQKDGDNAEDAKPTYDQHEIIVELYKDHGVLDHCIYKMEGSTYLRLSSLYEELKKLGFEFKSTDQLRTFIHRQSISPHLVQKFPELSVKLITVTE